MKNSEAKFVFSDKKKKAESSATNKKVWKLLIVDDSQAITSVTEQVFKKFRFEGRGIEILTGFSGAEAKELIQKHPDTAVILLDVMMETDDAGLQVVTYIRKELKNKKVRILLRTGQAAYFSEEEVFEKYDINDFLDKGDLTSHRLKRSVKVALRAFRMQEEIESGIKREVVLRADADAANEEKKLRELELMQQEKLVTLGLVSMGVAHEVNNPNTFVRGNAQTLEFYWRYFAPALTEYAQAHPELKIGKRDFSFISQDAPNLLKQIIEGTSRIKKVVDALLSFGHKEDHFVRTQLIKVMEQARMVVRNTRSVPLALNMDISAAKHTNMEVFGSPAQLLQVLMNLLNNAADSVGKAKVAQKKISLRLIAQEKYYLLQVQDNGLGIEEKNLERIFEPFFTSKEVGKGIGLGLHVCSTIVRHHQGKITARNAPEGGAIFEIQLPRK